MNTFLALIAVYGPYALQVRQEAPAVSEELMSLAATRLKREQVLPPGPIDVCVDARIELFNIIFRLAGSDEFRGDHFRRYSTYLDARFNSFKGHPAVDFARKLRQEPGIGWDAVVLLAVQLGDLPGLRPRADLNSPTLTSRWRTQDAEKFSALAASFARDSDFSGFLKESRPLHKLASLRMQRLVHSDVDSQWFSKFFGQKNDARFVLAVGLLNGPISYGVHANPTGGTEEIFANIGVRQVDEDGLPKFDGSYLATIVHEFSHSFVNPTVSDSKRLLQPAGEAFQKEVAALVQPLRYYYWQTLLEETLVRGVTIRYLLERKGEKAASDEIEQQKKEGYVWIEEVATLLAEYARTRESYSTFDKFMPRVNASLASLTPRLRKLVDGNRTRPF